ncbi:hypothetical protein ACWD4G_34910 [Streptomyces sp. NPDC002643]
MTTAKTARTLTRAGSARRGVRVVAVAAGLTVALALTGCSSDDGGTEAKESAAPSATSDSGNGDGGTGGSSGAETELQGNWLATTDGQPVALFVNGAEAAVFAGTSVCSGKVTDEANMRMLGLKCTDGSKDRTVGMVDSVTAKSLTITWEGDVGKETFQKTEGALPSGLPTDLPTATPGS